MSKFLVIGDPHLQKTNIDKVGPLMEAYRQYAWDHEMQMIFLGDLYHNHGIIHAPVHDYWFNYFAEGIFHERPIVLIGNHDMNNQVIPAWESESPIGTLPNIISINVGKIFDNIAFMPYCHTKEMFITEIERIPQNVEYLFCHQEFKGFTYENGIPTNDQSAEVPSRFKLVISGHIHNFQQSGNLVYLGAPYHQRKSDINNPRHVGIFDSETGKLEYLTDFEHLAPKIELIEQPNNIHKTPIKQDTRNLTLDELLLDIIDKKYENKDYGKQILESAREYLRTTA